jgi:hypothetical protein
MIKSYPGNRASRIALSICGIASGQKCFATCRSISASSRSPRIAMVPASVFMAFFNLKYRGEFSVARLSRDS